MNRLKEKRISVGLSQKQLAEKAGISVRTLQHYEQINSPKVIDHAEIKTILKICLALNCKIKDIIEDPDSLDLINKYE